MDHRGKHPRGEYRSPKKTPIRLIPLGGENSFGKSMGGKDLVGKILMGEKTEEKDRGMKDRGRGKTG